MASLTKRMGGMVSVLVAGGIFCAAGPAPAGPAGEVVYSPSHSSWYTRVAFDPHTGMGGASVTPKSLVFDSLTTKDAKGADAPALAESWKISADGLTMDFTLRRGVKFHNGDPFSARDVKFSVERAMREDLRFVYAPQLKRAVAAVEAVDDFHVRIRLKEPSPGILERLFYTAILPKGYVEKNGDAGFAAKPVGAGPFRVVQFVRDRVLEVEAVENHYRKTPHVKKFTLKNVPEPATKLAMLKTGETDLIFLNPPLIPSVKKDPNLKIFWNRHCLAHTLVFFDLGHPEDSPFKDIRVRRATSLAIDRKGIASTVLYGGQEAWGSFFAPYHPGFDAARNIPDPYDPKKARELLAEAGYAGGFDTVLVGHLSYRDAYAVVQQQLKDVGIRARLQVDESGTWASSFVAGKYRGIGYGSGPFWSGTTHPGVAAESHVTGTWSHNLATPAAKKAMAALLQAAEVPEIARRTRELDDILLKEMVRVPLWSVHQGFGARLKVEEFGSFPGLQHPMGFEFLKLKGQ